ncbi:hypothetical protein CSUB01_11571 [Colletotrichum sublineola]|uniref:Geranylgeranyl pyrophosphate synthetase n=1 Tax=Colletotrichum sublineola TaxID=1173701 RepID=A0A066X412_COLSU|nr:hypothetical protein CSUB01_11571 [Colletotrichum sublineola]
MESSSCERQFSSTAALNQDRQDKHNPTPGTGAGFAAIWQDVPLPFTLPKDKGAYFVDQNAERVPEFPFEPLFRATATMNQSFRFDDVDVLVNRNSLRKLLDFCAGRRQDSFRFNLHLIHRTLVIERCEKNARKLVMGSQDSGWGRNFERLYTKYPPGLEDSASHHRALRYQLGELVCVVRFEVDACYGASSEAAGGPGSLTSAMNQLSVSDRTVDNTAAIESPTRRAPMAQATAAEIKTASKKRSLGAYLPQVWFGRTPWLIVGRHTSGSFEELKITNIEAQFVDWESRHQTELRMLVAVLAQLRKSVKENGGKHCVAVYEKSTVSPVIRVFPSIIARKAIPDDLRRRLWDSEVANTSI